MADILDSLSDSFETSPLSEGQSCRDHTLKTAVHLAAEKGNLKCLQMLLKYVRSGKGTSKQQVMLHVVWVWLVPTPIPP